MSLAFPLPMPPAPVPPYETTLEQIVRSDMFVVTLDGVTKLKPFDNLEDAERLVASLVAKDMDKVALIYKLHGQYKSLVPPMDVTYFD